MPKTEIKECSKHGSVRFVLEGRGYFRCASCRTEAVQRRREKLKEMALEYKGGKCVSCGYSKCTAAMEFHHTSPEHKDFSISNSGHTRSWERVKSEVDKCLLLCANCHREEHWKNKFMGP